jgi:hypothetical protein
LSSIILSEAENGKLKKMVERFLASQTCLLQAGFGRNDGTLGPMGILAVVFEKLLLLRHGEHVTASAYSSVA